MKHGIRSLVLLIVLALIMCMLPGCGNGDDEPAATGQNTPEPVQTDEQSADVTEDEHGEEQVEETSYFPLETPETISIWMSYPPIFGGLADDGPEDFAFYIEAQRQMNIEIEWLTASYVGATDSFAALIAGGEYPDIIWSLSSYYAGSLDGAIDDEIIIDHKPYIEEYMPNMCELFDSGESYWKDITTDAGHIPYISMCNPPGEPLVTGGWVVNTDLLAETGSTLSPEEINTIDEITEIATQMKQLGICEYPIWMPYTGYYYGSSIGAAYGTSITFQSRAGQYAPFFYAEDGTLSFGGVGEGFREYLTQMNSWYAAGLIDPDFIAETESDSYANESDIVEKNVAFFRTSNNYINYDSYRGTDSEVNLAAIPDPVLYDGQQLTIGEPPSTVTAIGSGSVTTALESDKYELVFRFFDWFFSEEGNILVNYGVEGESFEYIDSEPHYTDVILNPEGFSQNTLISFYTGGGTLNVGVADYNKYLDLYNDRQLEASRVWGESAPDFSDMLSQYISLTADELEVYSTAMTDIITYISENAVAFIRGDRALSTYEEYEQVIYDCGIEEVIEIMAAAQARYENR